MKLIKILVDTQNFNRIQGHCHTALRVEYHSSSDIPSQFKAILLMCTTDSHKIYVWGNHFLVTFWKVRATDMKIGIYNYSPSLLLPVQSVGLLEATTLTMKGEPSTGRYGHR